MGKVTVVRVVARQLPWQPGKVPVARVDAMQLPWQPATNVGPIVMWDCVKFGEIRYINMAVSGESARC